MQTLPWTLSNRNWGRSKGRRNCGLVVPAEKGRLFTVKLRNQPWMPLYCRSCFKDAATRSSCISLQNYSPLNVHKCLCKSQKFQVRIYSHLYWNRCDICILHDIIYEQIFDDICIDTSTCSICPIFSLFPLWTPHRLGPWSVRIPTSLESSPSLSVP